MPKQSTPKQDAATKLLDINGKLHEVMAALEVEKVVDEGIAVIPVDPIKASFTLASDAINIASNINLHGEPVDSTNKLRAVLQNVLDFYEEADGKLTLPAEVASDLSTVIINHLANRIHEMAMELIGATEKLQGCNVSQLSPDEAATIAKYCSGVLTKAVVTEGVLKHKVFGDKKVVQHYPTNIIHSLGIQQHKVETSSHTTGKKPDVAIEYHDSYGTGHAGSVARLKGVKGRLEKEGLLCFAQHPNLYCSGPIEADKLTNLAAFFSLVIDADITDMSGDTIPVVSDALWDYVGELVLKHGKDTWKSGQGHINWSALRNKWLYDKEIMAKSKIYGDLKQLAIHRDRHHELEEALGVDMGTHAGKKAVTDIASNADKAVALCEKNSWGTGYLSSLKAHIQQFKASGSGNTSDAIGNIIHNILIDALQKLGEYGNCSTGVPLADVNAGALSYCEGTLKGTTTTLGGGGSQPLHKVAPKQYKSIIMDENPEGGYDVFIPIDKGFWSKELADYLESKFGFDCKNVSKGTWKPGQVCGVHIDSHDKIRLLAIFLSNLKGGSEAIGEECVPIAMQEAWNYAQEQAKKGVMAFTQEPIIESSKQWIDKCFKTYGIMPPGLTEEQKILMQLIGPDKIYAGCNLSAEETVPNMGIISYCEGVRTNPQAVISAHLTPQGYLHHFFHGETDNLADIFVNPLEEGKYEVEIKNIDMRSTTVTNEVIKRLKAMNYDCKGNMCQKEIGDYDIRWLAMFLSSLHQVHHLEAPQAPKAVDFAISQINAIPNDKKAYDNMVYPWTAEDWNKVLGKAPAVVTEEKPSGLLFEWYQPVVQMQLPKAGVNVSIPKAHIKKLIQEGKTKATIINLLTYNKAWANISPVAITSQQAVEVVDLITKEIKGVTQPPVPEGKVYPKLDWPYINSLPTEGKKPWELGGCVSYISAGPTKIKLGYCAGVVTEGMNAAGLIEKLPKTATLTSKENTHHIHGNGDIIFDSKLSTLYITLPDELAKIKPLIVAIEKSFDFQHTGETTWHKGATPLTAARVAYFFSQLHNITQLPESCWEAAVQHALEQVINIAFPDMKPVYPILKGDWMNDVCKIKAPKPPEEKPEVTNELILSWFHPGIPLTTSEVIENVDEIDPSIPPHLTIEALDYWVAKGNLAKEGDLYILLKMPEAPQPIDELIDKTTEAMGKIYKEITADQMKKAKETTAYKKLPKKIKDWMHLVINGHLLSGYKDKKTPEEILSELNYVFLELNKFPLTPLMIKLQMQIEKKSKVRKGELPAEPGEEVEKTLEETSSAELKNEVLNELKALYDSGTTNYIQLSVGIQNKMGLEPSPYLASFIGGWLAGYQKEVDKSNEPVWYLDMPKDMKFLLHQAISEKAAEGKDVVDIQQEIMEQFNIKKSGDWLTLVPKEVEAFQNLMAKSKVPVEHIWEDLPASEMKNYLLEAYGWAKGNPAYEKEQIIALFESKYNFAYTKVLDSISEQVVDSAKALKDGLVDKEKYTKPWTILTGWEHVPLEIAACMGEVMNAKKQGSTITGLYIPLINTKTPGFTEEEIAEWWKNCVEQYEAGLEEKPLVTSAQYESIVLSMLMEHPNAPFSAKNIVDMSPTPLKEPYVQKSLFKLTQQGKIQWVLHNNTYLYEELGKELEKEIPTIEQFMEIAPASAEEMEQLTVHLMEQSKYSANEISKAIAGKYAIKDDLSLTEWIAKIKDHHGLKVQLGPKFEELDDQHKKAIIDYIVEQVPSYPEDEVLSFVYGTHGVMHSDALIQEIKKINKEMEEGLPAIQEPDVEEEPKYIGELPGDELDAGKAYILRLMEKGSSQDVINELSATYLGVTHDDDLEAWVDQVVTDLGAEYPNLKEEEEPKDWSNLTDAQQLAFAVKVAEANVLGWDELKAIAAANNIFPDEDELPTLMELKEMAKMKLSTLGPEGIKVYVFDVLNEHPYEIETEIVVGNLYAKIEGDFEKPSVAEIVEALSELMKSGQIANPEQGVWLTLSDMKVWAGLPADKKQEIINFVALKSNLTESQIYPLIHQAYGVDANTLPSLALLYEASKKEEEEPEKKSINELEQDEAISIALKLQEMMEEGWETDTMLEELAIQYNVIHDEAYTDWFFGALNDFKKKAKEKKEPEAPSPEQMETYDEMIKAYYQVGWTPAAVMEFFAEKIPADQLKKTANKLYKIYKPEVVRITQEYDNISLPLQNHLSGLASKLLNEGKGVADVAWYISVNYGIEKESVKVMVRKVAEKPLAQVEAAVKAMQLLGVGEFIGGCRIIEPMSNLKPQNVAYCQGVLEKKGELENDGASILHAMGHQEIEVFNKQENGKWETVINLATDGGENNKEKLQGAWDILNDMLECNYPGGNILNCKISGEDGMTLPISDQDKLRKTALFLSSIDNVTLLDKACIPYALKHAMESAKKKNETSKPWTVNVYPNEVEDWNAIVCSKILA